MTAPAARPIAHRGNRQIRLGAAVVADVAEPDPARAGADQRGIGRPIGTAFNAVETEPQDVETLQPLVVDQRRAGDRRRLPQQALRIGSPLLVRLVGPWLLDQPAELNCDVEDEVVDLGGRGCRLNAEQLIQLRALVAIAEPGFDPAVDRKQDRDGHEEREEILREEAAKPISDNHAQLPENTTSISIRGKIARCAAARPRVAF